MPESIGKCVTDIGSIAALVNEAQERLLNDPLAPEEGWWGGWVKMVFNVTAPNATIITPREVARIVVMDVCKNPIRIRNGFYEYLQFGIGLQPTGCTTDCNQILQAYERETVISTTEFVGNKTVRAYPVAAGDVGKRVLVQGQDHNGNNVYTTDALTQSPIQGEYIVLTSPFVTTTNVFSTLTGLQKDSTLDDVRLFQVDPIAGTETSLATMAPSELTAQYRTYFLNGLQNNCCSGALIQVSAQCKLDYIPAKNDNDYLLIQSVPALIEECMSIRFGRMDTMAAQQMSELKHQKALKLLFGQLDNYLGKERTAIHVPLFGSDRLKTMWR
jgi:hypothetical protein